MSRPTGLIFLVLSCLLVGWLNVRVPPVQRLVRYGHGGAEFLELIQLEQARSVLGHMPAEELLRRPDRALRLLDGQYPPGLHWLAAGWLRVEAGFGQELGGVEDTLGALGRLNLLFLAGLALGTAWLCAGLNAPRGAASGPLALPDAAFRAWKPAWLAPALLLLCPAIFATTRRYYYDLPMVSCTTLALAALVWGERTGRTYLLAGLFSGLACLIKWQAALQLAPAWAVMGVVVFWPKAAGRGALRAASRPLAYLGGLGLAMGGAGMLAVDPSTGLGESLRAALGQAGAWLGPGAVAQRIFFYIQHVIMASVGPWLSLGWGMLGLSLLWTGRDRSLGPSRRPSTGTWPVLASLLLPLGLLCLRVRVQDDRFVLPMLPLLAAWGVARAARSPFWGDLDPTDGRKAGVRLDARARIGTGLLLGIWVLGAWQALQVDGLVSRFGAPRGSVAFRGWSGAGEGEASPYGAYLAAAGLACPGASAESGVGQALCLGGGLGREEGLAWRWAGLVACPASELLVLEHAVGKKETGDVERCGGLVSGEDLALPGSVSVAQVRVPDVASRVVWVSRR